MNDEVWVIDATGRTGKALATRSHAAAVLLGRNRQRWAPSDRTDDFRRVLPRAAGPVASPTVGNRVGHISITSVFGTPTANEVHRAVDEVFLPAALAQGCYAAATYVTAPLVRVVGKGRGGRRPALDLRKPAVGSYTVVVAL